MATLVYYWDYTEIGMTYFKLFFDEKEEMSVELSTDWWQQLISFQDPMAVLRYISTEIRGTAEQIILSGDLVGLSRPVRVKIGRAVLETSDQSSSIERELFIETLWNAPSPSGV